MNKILEHTDKTMIIAQNKGGACYWRAQNHDTRGRHMTVTIRLPATTRLHAKKLPYQNTEHSMQNCFVVTYFQIAKLPNNKEVLAVPQQTFRRPHNYHTYLKVPILPIEVSRLYRSQLLLQLQRSPSQYSVARKNHTAQGSTMVAMFACMLATHPWELPWSGMSLLLSHEEWRCKLCQAALVSFSSASPPQWRWSKPDLI